MPPAAARSKAEGNDTVICVGILLVIAVVLLTGAVSRFPAWRNDDEWDFAVFAAWIAPALGFAVCPTKLLYLTGRIGEEGTTMPDSEWVIAALQGRMGRAKKVTIGRVLAQGIILTLIEQRKEIERWQNVAEKLRKETLLHEDH